MSWTTERVELLKKLWAEGLSASQIAAQLGEGLSRNAVIGKVHRLKLAARVKEAGEELALNDAQPNQEADAPESPSFPPAEENELETEAFEEVEDLESLAMRRLSLLQLTETTCKWPLGDPLSEDFAFCGLPTDTPPYCSHHAKQAYQTVNEKGQN